MASQYREQPDRARWVGSGWTTGGKVEEEDKRKWWVPLCTTCHNKLMTYLCMTLTHTHIVPVHPHPTHAHIQLSHTDIISSQLTYSPSHHPHTFTDVTLTRSPSHHPHTFTDATLTHSPLHHTHSDPHTLLTHPHSHTLTVHTFTDVTLTHSPSHHPHTSHSHTLTHTPSLSHYIPPQQILWWNQGTHSQPQTAVVSRYPRHCTSDNAACPWDRMSRHWMLGWLSEGKQ